MRYSNPSLLSLFDEQYALSHMMGNIARLVSSTSPSSGFTIYHMATRPLATCVSLESVTICLQRPRDSLSNNSPLC
jgi:hypothetical protein